MQGAYLRITIGLEFFLLVGYLFYLVFRFYTKGEDRLSLLKWIIVIISLITAGLTVSISLVATRMSQPDLVIAVGIVLIDIVGVYLLIDDSQRVSRTTESPIYTNKP
jgi:hypothetical protein